jgi:hypothetical protein
MNQFRIADAYLHPSVNICIIIKTFHILDGEEKLPMKNISEQIFTICAYLVNLQSPVVKR